MSLEMFLKMDGVTGGSKNFNHKGWSDVHSWGWAMISNRGSSHVTDKDKTSFREISIVKKIGMDSTAIMLLYAQGKVIPTAELDIIPIVAKREARQKYLTIRMEDVLVKSIITGGNSSEDAFNENIILLFDKIHFEYNVNAVPGMDSPGKEAANYDFNWDIAQNKEL